MTTYTLNSVVQDVTQPPVLKPTSPASAPIIEEKAASLEDTGERSSWSLRGEIYKRSTDEMSAIEDTQPAYSLAGEMTPWAVRTSATKRTVQMQIAGRELYRARRRAFQLQLGLVCLALLIVGSFMLSMNRPAATTPTPVINATVELKASDAFDYFRKTGLTVSNFQAVGAPNTTWNAKEEIRFDVQQGQDRGSVLLLTYTSSAIAAADQNRAAQVDALQNWGIARVSNFLVVSFPGTSPALSNVVINRLKLYIAQNGGTS